MRASHGPVVLAGVAFVALAGACVGACTMHEDPAVNANGPTFLVVGKSSEQPTNVAEGVSMYVEARGGNYVGLLTHGCGHTIAGLSDQAASCGALPDATDPLYFLVDIVPGEQCVVEARLYYVCDEAGLTPLGLDGQGAFEWCDAVGSLMGSVQVPLLDPLDGSTEATIDDASVPTANVGDVKVGNPL